MEKLSKKLSVINTTLSEGDAYSEKNKHKLQQILLDKAKYEKSHENAENAWLELTETLEQHE